MKPNILFICTDQQRYDMLSCYGNPHIHTPTIDSLAETGVLFEQCYVQNPVCAPSRASLLTGRYPHAHGLWGNGVSLPAHEQLFTRALADDGYDCGMIGKWHQSACHGGRTEPRLDDGFRFYQWAHDPTHGSPENKYHRWLEKHHPERYAEASANGFGRTGHVTVAFDTMPTEAHYSHWVAEMAIDFLNEQTANDGEQPFFLWANFYDPHHPFVAPQEYIDRVDRDALPRPIGYDQPGELDSKPEVLRQASAKSYGGIAKGFLEYTEDEVQDAIAANYAMVMLIDDEIKRILATLEALGLRENTLIIFTSDHGEMQGDHHLFLKGPMMYDPAVRVPLILHWPGVLPEGERRSDVVQWIDLCPTMLDAANLPPLPRNQAQSLLPLARGNDDAEARGWAICEYRDSGHPYDPAVHTTMLRHDRYKLIVFHGDPATARKRTGELYDLEADPNELVNLWNNAEYIQLRLELQEMLLDVLVATEDRSQPREAYW
ncbi:MAG: sulfatase-like hydrolase/transferase [Chloroflexota bacterium]